MFIFFLRLVTGDVKVGHGEQCNAKTPAFNIETLCLNVVLACQTSWKMLGK